MIKYFLEKTEWELKRATEGASGFDVRADFSSEERILEPGVRFKFSTGLYLEMPLGVEAQLRSRSGLSINHGIVVINAPGTVDSDYRGEVQITLINLGKTDFAVRPGDRIAQIVFAPVLLPDLVGSLSGASYMNTKSIWEGLQRVALLSALSHTDRGTGGHGSTGR